MSAIPLMHGGSMTVPCPSWCADTHDHGREFPADITHTSNQITITLPVHGGEETILRAQIVQSPFDPDRHTPAVVLWPCDDGEPREDMSPADMDETINALETYLNRLRTLRTRLVAARDEHQARRG